ncbi:hypothetical protein JTE90_012186 [Oedothorax gibbosus]|uniref:Uncharacterized protein n=1 Tax=Oedothorax gibbosus TaxID=931172 RepID=A0AAV6V9W8_9ARAC|nr:hypothetical protein JTE90_012186 [Oedothorax gibbosus]
MSPLESELEFEDLLADIGDYGKYQKRLIWYFLVPSAVLLPWFCLNILFIVLTPDHWCNVPELASSNLSIAAQRSIIAPESNSSCFRYDLNYTEVLINERWHLNNDTPLVSCDRGWKYDDEHFDETAATKDRPQTSVLPGGLCDDWNIL